MFGKEASARRRGEVGMCSGRGFSLRRLRSEGLEAGGAEGLKVPDRRREAWTAAAGASVRCPGVVSCSTTLSRENSIILNLGSDLVDVMEYR